jgi:Flp pilus assembly protein TadD
MTDTATRSDTPARAGRTRSAAAFRRGAELHAAGRLAEAEALLREAVTADPADARLWNARGVMLAGLGRTAEAAACYREAIARLPDDPGFWTNLGNALTKLKQPTTAIACHRRAIALARGGDALLHHNLGISLGKAGFHGDAVISHNRALELKPDHHMARWDRARCYLHLGNFREGFRDYEARIVSGQLPPRPPPGAAWDGSPYAGRRLLLISEQGFGDTLWVARYLPRVKALGGELVVECRDELVELIAAMGVADQVIPRRDPLPPADLHCHICSLPGLFTSDFASIPALPYLAAPPERRPKFAELLRPAGDRLKVGIVWSGSVTFGNNQERAQPLARFLEAFAMPGVALFSLQKGPPQRELAETDAAPITDLASHIGDFADTAAAVAQLDLVIMTDSAVAHLAGALGRPVWLLLGQEAHWLWMEGRSDSPWYPSLRLIRPRGDGDWAHVFDTAAADLMQRALVRGAGR